MLNFMKIHNKKLIYYYIVPYFITLLIKLIDLDVIDVYSVIVTK